VDRPVWDPPVEAVACGERARGWVGNERQSRYANRKIRGSSLYSGLVGSIFLLKDDGGCIPAWGRAGYGGRARTGFAEGVLGPSRLSAAPTTIEPWLPPYIAATGQRRSPK
jgi:hypothetical protein